MKKTLEKELEDCNLRIRMEGGQWCRDKKECPYKVYNVMLHTGGDEYYYSCEFWERCYENRRNNTR
jgi:hypothetical protein